MPVPTDAPPPSRPEPSRAEPRTTAEWIRFAQRAFVVSCVVAAVALGLLFIWYAAPLLLLVFAGILVSIPLRLAKHAIEERTPLGSGASLTVVLLALTALLVTTGGAIVGSIMSQATTLASQLQEAARTVQERMQDSAWAGLILQQVPSLTDVVAGRTDALSRVFGLASSTLTWVVNALIVIVVGIYVAAPDRKSVV